MTIVVNVTLTVAINNQIFVLTSFDLEEDLIATVINLFLSTRISVLARWSGCTVPGVKSSLSNPDNRALPMLDTNRFSHL